MIQHTREPAPIPDEHRQALLALSREVGGALVALDTSGPVASVGLVRGHDDLCWERWVASRVMRSEAVVETLQVMAREVDLRWPEVRGLVVGLGPGSFTGIRVGLATAKGIAMGAGVPIYGVSSLGMLALSYGPGAVGVALDAGHGDLYSAVYCRDDGAVLPDALRSLPDTAHGFSSRPLAHLVGERATEVAALLIDAPPVEVSPAPRALWGVHLAAARLRAGKSDALGELAPQYLRLSQPERLAEARQAR